MFTTLLTTLAITKAVAGYTLVDDYSSNFFGMFDFFTDADPTHGLWIFSKRSQAYR